MIKSILKNIEQCDDFHNRCDYLLEHDESTHLIEYITELEKENSRLKESLKNASSNYTKYIQERDDKIKRVTDHCYQQIFDLQIGWFPQDMYTTTEVGAKHKVYNEILNLLEDKDDN